MQDAGLYTDFNAIAGLRREARASAGDALRPVAAQFEALFLQSMLKAMRDAVPSGGLFDSQRMDSYQGMYDQQMALDMSRQGGVGLAEAMVEQLRSAGHVPGSEAPAAGGPGALKLPPRAPVATLRAQAPVAWEPADPAAFIRDLRPHAERVGERLGVPPGMLIAQAALETGWGKHTLAQGAGSSFNVFNIKAGSAWQGRVAEVTAVEYLDGEPVMQRSRFRAYDSLQQAFDDYAALIAGSPRYGDALAAVDGPAYIRALQDAGYATDPAYAEKILTLAARTGLGQEQFALNNSGQRPLTTP